MANWGRILSRGNVEDRRGLTPATVGGISAGGLALLLLVNIITGGDLGSSLEALEAIPIENQSDIDTSAFQGADEYEVFTATVLGSNNEMWASVFEKDGKRYKAPRLVLFRVATPSACGTATSSVGPHYCPLDETIYLDETFFDELQSRFGASGGDVAEAYVISHEVAHHVQNQLGIMEEVHGNISSEEEANDLSIKLELQADCFAGLWANSVSHLDIFLPGEINEAIDAAAAVGDDRIQEKVAGYINPESWTHGSSQERVTWFNTGYQKGLLSECNTFN